MAIQKKNDKLSYDARSNFGLKGWWIIIFSLLNWAFFGGLTATGMNFIVPELAGQLQVDQGNLLSLSTPANLLSLFTSLVAGALVTKWGAKRINGAILILAAAAVFAWGASSSMLGYTISLFCVVCLLKAVELIGGHTYPAQWFPRKKGIALGWATMGLNLAGAVIVPILTALTAALGGIKYALWVMAGGLVVMFILNTVAFKNYPEEWNAYPDNDPNAERIDPKAMATGWTNKQLLKQKELWLLGLGNGVYAMISIGFVSTLVPTMLSRGYSMETAVAMMAITSILGLVGSYLCGLLDQKCGSKTAVIIYGIVLIVGIIFFFIPGNVANWIFVIILGMTLGGSSNYPASTTAQVFGRFAFTKAFNLIYFVQGAICSFNFAILGQSVARTGSYNAGWIILGVLCAIAVVLFCFTNMNPKPDPIKLEE